VRIPFLLFLLVPLLPLHAGPVRLTISAAISLKVPLEALKARYEKANPGAAIVFNFGSSGALQQQIMNGAPVDVFVSAAAKQMDELQAAGLIEPSSRFVLVGNTLVLIAPVGSANWTGFEALASADVRWIAIGEPKSVPAGIYAMETLEHLRAAGAVKDKLVYGKDVRQVLTYVEGGNADAGFVYGSDAAGSKSVRIAAIAPEDSHRKIEYPAAVVKASPHAVEASAFLAFLRTEEASKLFKSAGFVTFDGSN